MDEINIEAHAKELVKLTIKMHKEKLLGKENMSTFIKRNINFNLNNNYDEFSHHYSRYLAKEGYEIKQNINNFDIINYNSEEYQIYINNLN